MYFAYVQLQLTHPLLCSALLCFSFSFALRPFARLREKVPRRGG